MTKSQVQPILLGLIVYIIMEQDAKFLLEFYVVIFLNSMEHRIRTPEFYPFLINTTILQTHKQSSTGLSRVEYTAVHEACSSEVFLLPLSFCHLFCVLTNYFQHNGN